MGAKPVAVAAGVGISECPRILFTPFTTGSSSGVCVVFLFGFIVYSGSTASIPACT